MKKVEKEEARRIDGGRWACNECGTKYWTFINAIQHCNCKGHYKRRGRLGFVRWCWW